MCAASFSFTLRGGGLFSYNSTKIRKQQCNNETVPSLTSFRTFIHLVSSLNCTEVNLTPYLPRKAVNWLDVLSRIRGIFCCLVDSVLSWWNPDLVKRTEVERSDIITEPDPGSDSWCQVTSRRGRCFLTVQFPAWSFLTLRKHLQMVTRQHTQRGRFVRDSAGFDPKPLSVWTLKQVY